MQDVFERRQGRHRRLRKHDSAFAAAIVDTGWSATSRRAATSTTTADVPSGYVREEVLEPQFTRAIRQPVLTPEFLSDAKAALQQSRAKETHLREQTVARFRAEQAWATILPKLLGAPRKPIFGSFIRIRRQCRRAGCKAGLSVRGGPSQLRWAYTCKKYEPSRTGL